MNLVLCSWRESLLTLNQEATFRSSAFITFKELAGLESEKAMVVSSANSVKDRREGEECRSLI